MIGNRWKSLEIVGIDLKNNLIDLDEPGLTPRPSGRTLTGLPRQWAAAVSRSGTSRSAGPATYTPVAASTRRQRHSTIQPCRCALSFSKSDWK